jgi:hypothetical protein
MVLLNLSVLENRTCVYMEFLTADDVRNDIEDDSLCTERSCRL